MTAARRRGRPPRISRDRIVEVGLGIAREQGIKRVTMTSVPDQLQPFFDPAKSVLQFDTVPAQDQIGPYPCDNCPSTGGSQTPAAAS